MRSNTNPHRFAAIVIQAIVVLLVALPIYFKGADLVKTFQLRQQLPHWPQVEASISKTTVTMIHLRNHYRPQIRVNYPYLGVQYSNVPLSSELPVLSLDYRKDNALLAAQGLYPVGGQLKLLVDPGNSDTVRLVADRNMSYSKLSICVVLVCTLLLMQLLSGLIKFYLMPPKANTPATL